jgi:O-antigen/teichoic acid export membrane protein
MTLKMISIGFTFLTVPIILKLLGSSNYGTWLTITSIASWLIYMDAGLGNGLRNKLSIALVNNDKLAANEITSTTYFIFISIMSSILLLTSMFSVFINWNSILNTEVNSKTLLTVVIIFVVSTCIKLILDLANTIFLTLDRSYVKSITDAVVNTLILITVYLLEKNKISNFLLFSIITSVVPLLVILVSNYYLFRKKSYYSFLKPRFSGVKKRYFGEMLKLGGNFFIIQLFGIIIFSTDNVIISYFFSPSDVTIFNIIFKYFSISTFLFSIVMTPYWSAFTISYLNNDITWIRGAFKKLLKLWVLQIALTFTLILFSDQIFKFWIGKDLYVSKSLLVSISIYTIVYNWNSIFSNFLNGVAKIKLQLFSAYFVGIINIPLTIIFIKYLNLGVSSVIIVNTLCLLISAIWSPIQCYKILNKTATGIWNK